MQQLSSNSSQHKRQTGQPYKLLRIKDVSKITGISRSHIYNLCNNNLFPKSLSLVPGGTSVAWLESEIQEWIKRRLAERDGGVSNE